MSVPLAMLLVWSCISDIPAERKESAVVTVEKVYSVAECESMPILEFGKYVERLAGDGNVAALRELCQAKFGHAITVYTEILGDQQALTYCKSFPVGSYEWRHAFWGLSSHPREAMIGYVKQTCNTKNPWVRAHCYSLCLKAGWDDLIEDAKKDMNDETPMLDAIGQTLGTRARSYLKWLPEVQKQLSIPQPFRR